MIYCIEYVGLWIRRGISCQAWYPDVVYYSDTIQHIYSKSDKQEITAPKHYTAN